MVFRVNLLEKKYHTVCTFKTLLIFFHCRYILLKERNRIMTLESELERQGLYMTDAWRMEKVSQNNQIRLRESSKLWWLKKYIERKKRILVENGIHIIVFIVFGISVSRLLYNNLFLKIVNCFSFKKGWLKFPMKLLWSCNR